MAWAQNHQISGQVRDNDNFPIPHAYLTFENQENNNIYEETYTDNNGNFRLALPAGEYTIIVQPLGGGWLSLPAKVCMSTTLLSLRH